MGADHNTTIEPLLVDLDTLLHLLGGISRSSFFDMKARGLIGPVPVRLNSKLHYVRSEIESWLSARDLKTGRLPTREQWLQLQGNR
jgi:predicted DNA-binding transcriptional regulator AlpA